MMGKRHDEEPAGDQRQAAEQQALLAEVVGQAADQPTLQRRRDEPDIGENIADPARPPAELRHRPYSEDALHPGDGEKDQEVDQYQARQHRAAEYTQDGSNAAGRRGTVAPLCGEALGQQQSDAEEG